MRLFIDVGIRLGFPTFGDGRYPTIKFQLTQCHHEMTRLNRDETRATIRSEIRLLTTLGGEKEN